MSFLHLAFGMPVEVVSYHDEAAGVMRELSPDVHWIREVIRNPRITYHERSSATATPEARLHELAARTLLHRQLDQDEGDGGAQWLIAGGAAQLVLGGCSRA